jgi:hypothetical protein
VSDLFILANRAKSCGAYDLANVVFTVLLARAFDARCQQDDLPPSLWLEWETDDPEGDHEEESLYYDLLVVACWEAGRVHSLCIPVPLLNPSTALRALKRATRVDRRVHHRRISLASAEQVAALREEFTLLVISDEVQRAAGLLNHEQEVPTAEEATN